MLKAIIKAAILGILAAFAAVVLEQLAAVVAEIFFQMEIVFTTYKNLGLFLVLGAIIEEVIKYAALWFVLWKRQGTRGKNLIASSLFLGLFFGIAEIGLILLFDPKIQELLWNFNREIVFSFSTIILIQASTALFMGVLIATQKEKSRLTFLKILLFPILIHLLFNFLVIQKGNFTNWLIGIVLAITFAASLLIIAFNFRELD